MCFILPGLMESKNIPLSNINDNPNEHETGILGAMAGDTNGHMKGPWNHIYTRNISPASASYASLDNNGYTKLNGLSWPPRMYVCNFCKREFRSAQALGGHMNVHRRDRAMLRVQSPPASPSSPADQLFTGTYPPMTNAADSLNLNLILSPNPNLIYSSSWMIQKPNNKTANYITHTSTEASPRPASPLIISSSYEAPVSRMVRWSATRPNPFQNSSSNNTPIDAHNRVHHSSIQEMNINNARERGGLLRLGFGTSVRVMKEDVDLELRLGYSS